MSRCKVKVEPSALLLLAGFVLLSSPVLLAALLLASLSHELGHYAVLRLLGGRVKELYITIFGAEMQVTGRTGYGGEFLTTLAGPLVNLLLAAGFSFLGKWLGVLYLFYGAQAVLGVFNLLPIRPLDGGTLLWTAVAYFTEPYTADRVAALVGFAAALCLTGFALALLLYVGGTPFFLLAAVGLLWYAGREIGLVKRMRKR